MGWISTDRWGRKMAESARSKVSLEFDLPEPVDTKARVDLPYLVGKFGAHPELYGYFGLDHDARVLSQTSSQEKIRKKLQSKLNEAKVVWIKYRQQEVPRSLLVQTGGKTAAENRDALKQFEQSAYKHLQNKPQHQLNVDFILPDGMCFTFGTKGSRHDIWELKTAFPPRRNRSHVSGLCRSLFNEISDLASSAQKVLQEIQLLERLRYYFEEDEEKNFKQPKAFVVADGGAKLKWDLSYSTSLSSWLAPTTPPNHLELTKKLTVCLHRLRLKQQKTHTIVTENSGS